MEGNLGAPNSSVLGEHSLLVGSSWVAAFLCFIILLTTAGNFLLILLIITQRSLRNTSNYFLVSLFMSDLMVGLVVMPPAMLNQLYGRWVLRGDFCSLWASFDVMCCSASILNLCIISLDRYLLIISPLKYKLRMTSCRALWLILATWTVAALASFLPIKMGWHKLEFEELSLNVTSLGDEDQCRLVVSLPYALVASCLTFFLPSAAISFTYCRILLAARKQAVQVASLASNVASTSTTDDTIAQDLEHRISLFLGRGWHWCWQLESGEAHHHSPATDSLCPEPAHGWQREQEVHQQTQQEGTEGQSDPGHPPGHVLRGLAPLLHYQCDTGYLWLCPGRILRRAHLAGILQQHHEPHHLPTLHEGLQESHGQIPALLPALGGVPAQRHLPLHEELQQWSPSCHIPQERPHLAG
ncbi:5-hydroxytryptamine receptor 6 isoform X2 [Myiozetetes cayanensis]|uniref:5-hydroxytryptamine receptor 6 isoform X2 n=1 Tax=Myiozetetes cayanensis TaxID=478635 RepID=UPI00215F05A6|nr:5-hydroxytryptamine receptor 6 isoform X2 [Myiozetetes cayanensis]